MFQLKKVQEEGDNLLPLTIPPHFLNSPIIFLLSKKYTGKLLLREEIPLKSEVFDLLLANQFFIAINAIEKSFHKIKCMRCQCDDKNYFAMIDCFRCGENHHYCRNCIQMGRVLQCAKLYYWNGPAYPWPQEKNACRWKGSLTAAQAQAAKQMLRAVHEQSQVLCWAVTGAGKTEMIFPAIEETLASAGRVCIATPRTDVVRELFPRLKEAFPHISMEALYGGSEDKKGEAQIIISTTHQLFRYRRAFSLMIVDEVDAFPYYYDQSLQKAVQRATKKEAARILLTATPRKDLRRAIRNKRLRVVFVPVRYHQQALPVPRLIYVGKLQKSLEENRFPKQIKDWFINRKHAERQVLIFVPTIAIANDYVENLKKELLKIKSIKNEEEIARVHAEDEDRTEKIQLFRQKKLRVLVTTTILERGVTFPSIDVLVLNGTHHVFDDAALVQIAGRAGRSKQDPSGEVIIFHAGLTEDILDAIRAIKDMNRRRKKFLSNWEGNK